MTVLNLTNQRTKVEAALPTFQAFQTEMDKRKEVWDKLDLEKRRKWLRAAAGTRVDPKSLAESKDPVMWLAVKLVRYFNDWSVEDE